MVEFASDVKVIVLNLENENVEIAAFVSYTAIEGYLVKHAASLEPLLHLISICWLPIRQLRNSQVFATLHNFNIWFGDGHLTCEVFMFSDVSEVSWEATDITLSS